MRSRSAAAVIALAISLMVLVAPAPANAHDTDGGGPVQYTSANGATRFTGTYYWDDINVDLGGWHIYNAYISGWLDDRWRNDSYGGVLRITYKFVGNDLAWHTMPWRTLNPHVFNDRQYIDGTIYNVRDLRIAACNWNPYTDAIGTCSSY